jgi:hypothetical protein
VRSPNDVESDIYVLLRQPKRIAVSNWIPVDIGIRIDPARKPARIGLDVSADGGVIVSEVVVITSLRCFLYEPSFLYEPRGPFLSKERVNRYQARDGTTLTIGGNDLRIIRMLEDLKGKAVTSLPCDQNVRKARELVVMPDLQTSHFRRIPSLTDPNVNLVLSH